MFLLLTAGGITSNLLWSVAETAKDVTTVYYPIDIIFAIIGFSAYWFKKYFRNASENMKLNIELQKGDKIKDQFLANTSHELRTPPHGIINIAHNVVTREKSRLDERSLEDMELLITIGRRMSHLLGDLLDVVRLKEHRIVFASGSSFHTVSGTWHYRHAAIHGRTKTGPPTYGDSGVLPSGYG